MKITDLKPYRIYLIICGLFIVTLIACSIIYVKYTSPLSDAEKQNEATSLEVKLPVIEWGKYEGLSKKHTNGIITE